MTITLFLTKNKNASTTNNPNCKFPTSFNGHDTEIMKVNSHVNTEQLLKHLEMRMNLLQQSLLIQSSSSFKLRALQIHHFNAGKKKLQKFTLLFHY
jgi:hypothetical protein